MSVSASEGGVVPLLSFNPKAFQAFEHAHLLAQLHDRGYAFLQAVFERDTVPAFREQLLAALASSAKGDIFDGFPDDSPLRVYPARAPRIRQVLQRALAPTFPPYPIMTECTWITKPILDGGPDAGWHKDYDAEGLMIGRCWYPPAVAISMYFEDMGDEHGSSEVVPGSHLDVALSPYRGSPRALLRPRMEDAVIWDQRLWHRGTSRRASGRRLHAVFGFYPSPILENQQKPMMPAQEQAWLAAETEEDRIFFGGIFQHPERRRAT